MKHYQPVLTKDHADLGGIRKLKTEIREAEKSIKAASRKIDRITQDLRVASAQKERELEQKYEVALKEKTSCERLHVQLVRQLQKIGWS